jgi:HD-like signal output (HDOD) protein
MRPFAMNPVTFELTVGLDGNARSGQGVLAAYVPASDFGVPVCLLSTDPRHEPETGIEEITPPLLAHIRDSIDDSEPLWCWCIIDSRGCFREALPKWQPHGFPTVSFQSFAGGFNIDAFLGVTGPAGEAAMELLSKMLDIPATDSDSPSEREFLEKVEVHGNLPAPGNIFRKVDAAVAKGDVRLVAAAIQPDPVLSLSLINSANAARFANAGRTASVPESVMRLGTSFVRRIVFVAEMMGRYQSGACSTFDYRKFWLNSLASAAAMRALMPDYGIPDQFADDAFTTGLVGGIGWLAVAETFPSLMKAYVARCKDADPITKARAQRELFPCPVRKVSERYLERYAFPALVLQAVAGDVSGGRAWYDCLAQAVRVAQALEPFECIATPTNIPVPDACRTEWESWHQALSVIS